MPSQAGLGSGEEVQPKGVREVSAPPGSWDRPVRKALRGVRWGCAGPVWGRILGLSRDSVVCMWGLLPSNLAAEPVCHSHGITQKHMACLFFFCFLFQKIKGKVVPAYLSSFVKSAGMPGQSLEGERPYCTPYASISFSETTGLTCKGKKNPKHIKMKM